MSGLLDDFAFLSSPREADADACAPESSTEVPTDLAELEDVDSLLGMLQREGVLEQPLAATQDGDRGMSPEQSGALKKRMKIMAKVQVRYYALLAQGMRANLAAAQAIIDVTSPKAKEGVAELVAASSTSPADSEKHGRSTKTTSSRDLRCAVGGLAGTHCDMELLSPRCGELILEGYTLLNERADENVNDVSRFIAEFEEELHNGMISVPQSHSKRSATKCR